MAVLHFLSAAIDVVLIAVLVSDLYARYRDDE